MGKRKLPGYINACTFKHPVCYSLKEMLFCFVGYDGVELNVLDDILGEQANDEFAAELDTATVKTSGK